MARVWIRTCQECLHRQKAKDPASYKDTEGSMAGTEM